MYLYIYTYICIIISICIVLYNCIYIIIYNMDVGLSENGGYIHKNASRFWLQRCPCRTNPPGQAGCKEFFSPSLNGNHQ